MMLVRLNILLVTFLFRPSRMSMRFYREFGNQALEADQGCGETGQLYDAPIPGVKSHHGRRLRRSVTTNERQLWDSGIIPYILDSKISGSGQRLVRRAMDHWESDTCIRFVKRTTQQDYVDIYRGQGCCSHVGRAGDKQRLSLGVGCLRFGIIVHELGHTIGFWHEQNRPDRSSFIDVMFNNVESGKFFNFDRRGENSVETFDQDYDYKSIMHYGANFFSKNGDNTINPKNYHSIHPNEIGDAYYSYSGPVLSKIDILKTNLLYRCSKVSGCGGTLFKNKGTFTSEYYPLPYIREQRDCTWVITANNTKHSSNASRSLTLSFEDFHVGQADKVSRSCDADYVEIREGKGFLSPFKVRLCGDKKPDPIITLQESLYVRLHSTAIPPVGLDNEFRRFKASFKTDYCSQQLTSQGGTINSPHYPLLYSPNTDCLWTIKILAGYKIVIKFNSFNLRPIDPEKGCLDYVEVQHEGDRPVFIGRYCDRLNPGTLTLDSNKASIRLHSSEKPYLSSPSGFQATYTAEDVDECALGNHGCTQGCVNYQGSYECACWNGYRFVRPHDDSGGSCLDMDECAFKNGGCSHQCINTDGSYFCHCPKGYTLSENKTCTDIDECAAPLNPCSHNCINYPGGYECKCKPGFILKDNQLSCTALTNCGGDLTAALGEIQSPLVPLSYVGDVVCRWKISVKEGHGVMLSFNLPWKYNKGCQTFISVKEISQYEEEVQEMKICSKSDIPEEITMETNAVVLEYHAKHPFKTPFIVHYRSAQLEPKDCGKEFNSSLDTFQSPGYPFKYLENSDCKWIINPKMGFKLKLVFLDFHIEPGTNCTFDYVEVEQHSVEHAVVKKIGRFCGNTIPNSIETDSRYKLVVKFHSDPTIQMQGFRAMFSRER